MSLSPRVTAKLPLPSREDQPDRQYSALRILLAIAIIAITIIIPTAAVAQTTRAAKPAAVPPIESFEDQPLRHSTLDSTKRSATSGTTVPSTGMDLQRVLLALLAIVALLLGLRWLGKRLFALPVAGRGGAVHVLSRSIIAPRQQVLMLKVGKRVVVVGDSGGHMNALCQITDPDEVAELLAATQPSGHDTRARSFGNLFGRARDGFSTDAQLTERVAGQTASADSPQDQVEVETPAGVAVLTDEISSLMSKVRGLQQQFKRP